VAIKNHTPFSQTHHQAQQPPDGSELAPISDMCEWVYHTTRTLLTGYAAMTLETKTDYVVVAQQIANDLQIFYWFSK